MCSQERRKPYTQFVPSSDTGIYILRANHSCSGMISKWTSGPACLEACLCQLITARLHVSSLLLGCEALLAQLSLPALEVGLHHTKALPPGRICLPAGKLASCNGQLSMAGPPQTVLSGQGAQCLCAGMCLCAGYGCHAVAASHACQLPGVFALPSHAMCSA